MENTLLNEHTLSQLRALRLDGMVHALQDAATSAAAAALPFEERLGIVVQREIDWRDGKRLERLLKAAKLKVSSACLEDLDWRSSRGLDRSLISALAGGDWLRHGHNVLITGATGVGKTWLACALAQQAARSGFSVLYVRAPRLLEELRIAHGDGTFSRRLAQLARIDLLALDDFAIAPISAPERNDLLELLDDRVGTRVDPHHQPTAGLRVARMDQRSDLGRCHPRSHRALGAPDHLEGRVDAQENVENQPHRTHDRVERHQCFSVIVND